MSRLRPIDRAVADAWRMVRWHETGGDPICPICFDGADLQRRPADERNPALHRYRCTACDRLVSDVSGTWIDPLKAPLARWAWLLLSDRETERQGELPHAPAAMAARIGIGWETIAAMRERFLTAPVGLLDCWEAALRANGVTLTRLVSAVERGKS